MLLPSSRGDLWLVTASHWFLNWLILWPWRWNRSILKCQPTFNSLHGAIHQKTELFITTGMRTSSPTYVDSTGKKRYKSKSPYGKSCWTLALLFGMPSGTVLTGCVHFRATVPHEKIASSKSVPLRLLFAFRVRPSGLVLLELTWNYGPYKQPVGLLGKGSARCKALPTHRTVQTSKKCGQASMPRVGFEPTNRSEDMP
jgi:hypothetical protein